MISGRRHSVSTLVGSAAACGLLLAGCLKAPGWEAGGDPPVVTESGGTAFPMEGRAALLADMRADAAASAAQPHTAAELAARPEPRSAHEIAAIEAELELISRRRATSASPQEIAVLEARARELKRLAATAHAGPMRR